MVEGLEPRTLYRFRLKVTSPSGEYEYSPVVSVATTSEYTHAQCLLFRDTKTTSNVEIKIDCVLPGFARSRKDSIRKPRENFVCCPGLFTAYHEEGQLCFPELGELVWCQDCPVHGHLAQGRSHLSQEVGQQGWAEHCFLHGSVFCRCFWARVHPVRSQTSGSLGSETEENPNQCFPSHREVMLHRGGQRASHTPSDHLGLVLVLCHFLRLIQFKTPRGLCIWCRVEGGIFYIYSHLFTDSAGEILFWGGLHKENLDTGNIHFSFIYCGFCLACTCPVVCHYVLMTEGDSDFELLYCAFGARTARGAWLRMNRFPTELVKAERGDLTCGPK